MCGLPKPFPFPIPLIPEPPCTLKSIILPVKLPYEAGETPLRPPFLPSPLLVRATVVEMAVVVVVVELEGVIEILLDPASSGGTELLLFLCICVDTFLTILGPTVPFFGTGAATPTAMPTPTADPFSFTTGDLEEPTSEEEEDNDDKEDDESP